VFIVDLLVVFSSLSANKKGRTPLLNGIRGPCGHNRRPNRNCSQFVSVPTFDGQGELWAETLLGADLRPEELEEWAEQRAEWPDGGYDCGPGRLTAGTWWTRR